MNFRRVLAGIVSVFLLISLICVPATAQTGDSSVEQGCFSLDAGVSLHEGERLLPSAKSVVLFEMNTQTLVYAWNADEQMDPAGMNKIMTAMLALEYGKPDDVVTVTRYALDSVKIGSVSAGLKAGEELTLQDLLYCMMVKSANDAAAVIGDFIGRRIAEYEGKPVQKGLPRFVQRMNERALELGCTATQFQNPTGLTADNQYSTARDLAKITREALNQESFVELFCAKDYLVPRTNKSEPRELKTSNYLISKATVKYLFDERVLGGKTGARTTTDRSLISLSEEGNQRYLAVVMSAQGTVTADGLSVKTYGSFEETTALLDIAFKQHASTELLREQKVMGQFPVKGGENDVIGCPVSSIVAALPADANPLDVSYRCILQENGLQAPLAKGQVIGKVEVWFRSVCMGQCDLIAMFDVYEPGVNSYSMVPTAEEKAMHLWTMILLIGGITLVVVFILWCVFLLLRRKLRMMKVERRRRLIEDGPKKKKRRKGHA